MILAYRISGIKTKLVVREAVSVHKIGTFSVVSRLALKLLARFTYPMAHRVISVSNGVQKDLLAYIKKPDSDRYQVIYNPIEPNIEEKSNENMVDLPKSLSNKKFVLAVGRLSKPKDFDTLIRAIKKVQVHHDIGLIILGEGDQRSHLEKLIQSEGVKCAYMPGYVENIYPYIKAADIFVLSSIYEGMPNALIEALTLGIPIVATNCPSGPEEILDNGRLGDLVDVGDDDAMARAITKQLEGTVRVKFRDNDLARFSLTHIVKQYANAANVDL